MKSQEIIDALKIDFDAKIASLDVTRAEYASKNESLATLVSTIAEETAAANEAGFEEGLKQAGQAGGVDKLYSDAEMNQFLSEAKAPLEAQIASLQASIEELNVQIAAQAEAAASQAAAAVEAFKAELKEKYIAQQVAETEGETGFAALLG
jgi:flagellar biosynthesis/type III secretory pathway protein FliH